MAVPKRSELAKRQGKKKKVDYNNECQRQFPECPDEIDLEHSECKNCPFNGKKKEMPSWLKRL